jgi:hypothetical protein
MARAIGVALLVGVVGGVVTVFVVLRRLAFVSDAFVEGPTPRAGVPIPRSPERRRTW